MAEKIDIPNLREQTRKFKELIDDPHPGLHTWHEAFWKQIVTLRDSLTDAIEPKGEEKT